MRRHARHNLSRPVGAACSRNARRAESQQCTIRPLGRDSSLAAHASAGVPPLLAAVPAAAAAAEMANGGGSVPNGTYIDMCVNLPVVDPHKITCPVMIFRGDHDGIATDEDVMGFFQALPNNDKQLVMVSGQAHNTTIGINRRRFWHTLDGFLSMPPRIDNTDL